jgi:hypothetical protein
VELLPRGGHNPASRKIKKCGRGASLPEKKTNVGLPFATSFSIPFAAVMAPH